MNTISLIFLCTSVIPGFQTLENSSSAAERTKWVWRNGPLLVGSRVLFQPHRNRTQALLRLKSKRPLSRDADILDTVEVIGVNDDLYPDIMETDDMLVNEISFFNDTVSSLMSQRRPSYSPDGTLNLIPLPNFSFIPDIGPLRQLFQWGSKSLGSFAVCHACRVGLGYLLLQARTQATLEDLTPKAIFICKFFNIANDEVCTGLVQRFGPTMYFILTNRVGISANMFCGMVLQPLGCTTASYLEDWTVDLPRLPSEIGRYKASVPNKRTNRIVFREDDLIPSNRKDSMKILQLTDIHLDLEYRPGANTNCATELCCRHGDGDGKGDDAAGYYGDYRKCDLPLHSLENALHHIATQHPDIELIYMTGDLVAHNIWSTTAKTNAEVIHVASELIRKYFPTTRVIPVLGNHDVHPLNLFSPPGIPTEFSTDYIYRLALHEWESWIPRDAYVTFLRGGFYAIQITSTFKVIVLNTNVCYTLNFWQVYEHRDPGGQLHWLVTELQVAERQNIKVHILGHLPPSLDDCWTSWSRNFYKIINRFSSTVTSQFFAHTHYDEFQLHYDSLQKNQPISSIWIGASLTPFVNLNPGYKIFTVDLNSWMVSDHETWIYDLVQANVNSSLPPNWFRLYKATEAYQIPDVFPVSLNALVQRMSADEKTFQKYYKNYHKATGSGSPATCDKSCRKRLLCRIVTPFYLEQRQCIQIESDVDGLVLPRQIFQNQTSENVNRYF